jgi:hypothetical protein
MDLCLYKGCNFIAASGASYFVLGKQNNGAQEVHTLYGSFLCVANSMPLTDHSMHLDTKGTQQSVAA